jgi:sporulation protein YhbH
MGILSHDDWSLDRRGERAKARHREKVRQAIRDNLREIITDQGVILSNGKKTIRIPVQSLDEPHFTYDFGKNRHVGQGPGENGQPIGKAYGDGQPGAAGSQGAGTEPGSRVLEAEVTIEEVEAALFAELRLPNLRDKQTPRQLVEHPEFTDIRKRGIRANIDRRYTLKQALLRSLMHGQRLRITENDLRFKTWEETPRPQAGAVVLAMMDVSGSMGMTEKYLARSFFHWMERFLEHHYDHVEVRYLVHHVEAYETGKDEFYSTRESGGTLCSSVLRLALDIIRRDYPQDAWNIYPMYVGDGDNLFSDNEQALRLMHELCELSAMAGYLEVNPYQRMTSLSRVFASLGHPAFRQTAVVDRRHILDALRHFFSEQPPGSDQTGMPAGIA